MRIGGLFALAAVSCSARAQPPRAPAQAQAERTSPPPPAREEAPLAKAAQAPEKAQKSPYHGRKTFKSEALSRSVPALQNAVERANRQFDSVGPHEATEPIQNHHPQYVMSMMMLRASLKKLRLPVGVDPRARLASYLRGQGGMSQIEIRQLATPAPESVDEAFIGYRRKALPDGSFPSAHLARAIARHTQGLDVFVASSVQGVSPQGRVFLLDPVTREAIELLVHAMMARY